MAEDFGFINQGLNAPYSILPDYTIPLLGETSVSTILAGVVGALIVAAIVIGVGKALRKPKPAPVSETSRP